MPPSSAYGQVLRALIRKAGKIKHLKNGVLKPGTLEPFGSVHGIEENGPFQLPGRWYD
jgi:hypothetical protein